MAWYRCGGGGIPSSLKTDMNAVYNKKFGTSTTYDPSVWAETANLMGPLPEKTASGSVASITDGADTVPIKAWGVTVGPTLSGVSSVECTQAGVNILPITQYGTTNNVDASTGGVTRNGATSWAWNYSNTCLRTTLKSGSYKVYCWLVDGTGETSNRCRVYADDETLLSDLLLSGVDYATGTFTVNAITNIGIAIKQPTTTTAYIAICESSQTMTQYAKPNIVVSSVSLGRTIYGGSVDVVAGTGTGTHNKITLSSTLNGLIMAQIGTTGVYRVRFNLSDAKGAANTAVFSGACDYYTPSSANQTYAQNEGIAINTSGQCFIYDSRFNTSTSLNDFKTWIDANPVNLCYELATGTDFTFTPISPTPETPLGASSFWADAGDSSVTYRADISLLLGGN